MGDLISRSVLLESMGNVVFKNVPVAHQPYVQAACDAYGAVAKNVPAVNAEPVRHGKWVRHKPNGAIWTLKCSECGWIDNRITLNAKFNYCPNCGAKMDKEE